MADNDKFSSGSTTICPPGSYLEPQGTEPHSAVQAELAELFHHKEQRVLDWLEDQQESLPLDPPEFDLPLAEEGDQEAAVAVSASSAQTRDSQDSVPNEVTASPSPPVSSQSSSSLGSSESNFFFPPSDIYPDQSWRTTLYRPVSNATRGRAWSAPL